MRMVNSCSNGRHGADETVIASEAKQSIAQQNGKVDCFVASLLAMTPEQKAGIAPGPGFLLVMPRHRVSPLASPMTGSSGASSNRWRERLNREAAAYWIVRSGRTMTVSASVRRALRR